ncbi:MAG: ubiquitin-like domain-containing protein [Mycobacterium leprae]
MRALSRRSPAALAVSAAVTGGVVGTAAVVAGVTKDVIVTVDGASRTVHTFGDTVGDALDAAAVDVGSRDLVVPAPDAPVRDGGSVSVRHARPLTLTVDGRRRTAWVTATSVDEALDQLRVRADRAALSASRSRRIPRDGMDLTVEFPDRVTLVARGRTVTVTSTASTVGDALRQHRVRLGPADRVSVPLGAALREGQTIRVTQVVHQRVQQRVATAPPVVRRPTAALFRGDTRVARPGRGGQLLRVSDVTVVDGRPVKRAAVASRVLTAAVPRILHVGVRAAAMHVAGADGLNWAALARCESGGNTGAVSAGGTYRGLYQFSMSTWRSVGGAGDPANAAAGEQTYRAKVLYARSGRAPWPICGRHL